MSIAVGQEKRKELGIPQDAFLLMSVGELSINKNHSVIIKAISKIPTIHYAIAGQGNAREYLENLTIELGVADRVHILGFRTDIPELYAAADLCAFPSIREGQGIAVIEGMASMLPLIVSDNRGTRGFITTVNGIICKFDDVDEFVNGIKKLMISSELRYDMAKANKKKSMEFDKEIVNKIMRNIYTSI